MTAIARFEDIEAWQEARKLTKLIYALSNKERWHGILSYEARSVKHQS